MTKTYEIPDTIRDLFNKGENSYRIINYEKGMEMNNEEAMEHFLESIGATDDYIQEYSGTQVVLIHPDFSEKYTVDAGGLGDCSSHRFNVTLYEDS